MLTKGKEPSHVPLCRAASACAGALPGRQSPDGAHALGAPVCGQRREPRHHHPGRGRRQRCTYPLHDRGSARPGARAAVYGAVCTGGTCRGVAGVVVRSSRRPRWLRRTSLTLPMPDGRGFCCGSDPSTGDPHAGTLAAWRIVRALLWSLWRDSPQSSYGQVGQRSERVLGTVRPHPLQTCDVPAGFTTTTTTPASSALRLRIVRNWFQPAAAILLARQGLRTMCVMRRPSIPRAPCLSTILRASWWWKLERLLRMCRCALTTSTLARRRFLLLRFLVCSLRCRRASASCASRRGILRNGGLVDAGMFVSRDEP